MLLALRSASMLVCAVPVAAVVYPGNSKITHEPLSSSLRLMFRDDASLSARISVPASTVVSPLTVNFLPLRLRTIGGAASLLYRQLRLDLQQRQDRQLRQDRQQRQGQARQDRQRPPAAPGPPGPPRPPAPPAPICMRPISPLHTAAFQSGLI